MVLSRLAGSSTPGCQVVGTRTDVRSGSIAVGNFAQARKQFSTSDQGAKATTVFLYAIPEHSASMPGVRVTMERLSGGGSRTMTFDSVEQADQWKYYPVNLPVPSAGTWRLTMTAGADRGCFQVMLAR